MGSSQKIPDTSIFSQTGFTEEEYEDEGGGGRGVHGLTGHGSQIVAARSSSTKAVDRQDI